MKIEIHSFESIVERANVAFEPGTYHISIGDSDAEAPDLLHKPDRTLRLVFDDVGGVPLEELMGTEPSEEDRLIYAEHFRFFDDDQAESIADFVLSNKDDINVLICQCEYGQSRSAACAAAVTEYLHGNGIDIFSDMRYYPNKLVYEKTLAALRNYQQKGVTQYD